MIDFGVKVPQLEVRIRGERGGTLRRTTGFPLHVFPVAFTRARPDLTAR